MKVISRLVADKAGNVLEQIQRGERDYVICWNGAVVAEFSSLVAASNAYSAMFDILWFGC